MKTILTLIVIAALAFTSIYAQVGIGTTTPEAALDVSSTNDGLLFPRVALTATDVATINTPTVSELVYNTATSAPGPNQVTPGFYYWNDSIWVRVATGSNWSLTGNSGSDPNTNFIGTTDNQPLNFRVNNARAGQIGVDTSSSVFFGLNAGLNDDGTNNRNVFMGTDAGRENTTGYNNTAIGVQTLQNNTTGHDNTAYGIQALRLNTTGIRNTANGTQALYSNTTGAVNTANGIQALFSNTTGSGNTANGAGALSDNTTGNRNTANGNGALNNNTTGNNNTANGAFALTKNTIGNENTANGYEALFYNTTGNRNTANGHQALHSNTTGFNNTANGTFALRNNTTGLYNSANGYQALYLNTTGNQNTANGYQALYYNETGNNNTAIGYRAFFNGDTLSNSTALGFNAAIAASNQVRIGNSAVTSIGGFQDWTNVSDNRFKKDIKENVVGLDFIMKLRPVTFHLDMDAIANFLKTPDSLRLMEAEQERAKQIQTGFIAQEVEEAGQKVGFTFSGVDAPKNENDYYGLRYAKFVVPLVKAVQEQQEMIKNQQEVIETLQKVIETQQNLMASQQEEMAKQQSEIDELKGLVNKMLQRDQLLVKD